MNRLLPRALMAPAVVTLVLWMIVPLAMTIYFSFVNYNLMQPGDHRSSGLDNFHYFVTDPDFWPAVCEHAAPDRQRDRDHGGASACCWRCW